MFEKEVIDEVESDYDDGYNSVGPKIDVTRLQLYLILTVGMLGVASFFTNTRYHNTLLVTVGGSIFVPTVTVKHFIHKIEMRKGEIPYDRCVMGLILGGSLSGILSSTNLISYLMGLRSFSEVSSFIILSVFLGAFIGYFIIYTEEKRIRYLSEKIVTDRVKYDD